MHRHSIPAFIAAALALACGGGSSKTRDPNVAQPVAASVLGNSGYLQFLPLGNDTGASFAGSANDWDLMRDLGISDGFDDQFDGAMRIRVGTLASPKPATWSEMDLAVSGLTYFPSDQTYAELSFYEPAVAAPTLVAAAVTDGTDWQFPIAGTWSAGLAPAADSRLEQVVNLTSATGTITLTWSDSTYAASYFTDSGQIYRVAIRNPSDRALLATALQTTGSSGAHTFDLSSFAGSSVLLSFELRATGWGYALVDNVSVSDGTNQYVTNGDFETGNLSGWTTYAGTQSQNVVAGLRTVGGLDVTRGFYTSPGSTWARWVDVFSNPGASAVTRDVVYYTNLGSDGYGIIYATPGANGRALTSWDGGTGDRDVAIVHGNGQAFFSSATALNSWTGRDSVYVLHTITVPAGGKVAIVQYVVMDGNDTRLRTTTVDATAKATNVDGIAAGIAGNFGKDPVYMDYMTADQRAATIANW